MLIYRVDRKRSATRGETGVRHQADKALCPFVKNPCSDCYCFNLTSKTIASAIWYCGNDFESCNIYKVRMMN